MSTKHACVDRRELFESTSPIDHLKAAPWCDICPARAACHAEAGAAMREWGYDPGNGPRGTWAGVLYTKRGRFARVGGAA